MSLFKSKTVTGTKDGPHLLICGGVHGDEFEPMEAIRELIRRISSDQLTGRITFVPVVNEPAFINGTRTGTDGLDLARTFPGRPDGSITEKVAHEFSNLIRSADFFIDLHTGGTTLSVWPLTGYTLHSDVSVLDKQRRMAHAFNLPVVWGTTPNLEGRTLSVARDANIPAIYAEYLGSAVCNREGIDAYVDGCLNVMSELGMIPKRKITSMAQYVIEDDRPSSGYLQICNAAPCSGYFEPFVKLGDFIEAGMPIGRIVDPLGEEETVISSAQTGIVIVLRTFPKTNQGESVAVVLETEKK